MFKTDYRLCRSKVLQNAPREHSAILSTFIKLPFVFKTLSLSIFEWPLQTGFTVHVYLDLRALTLGILILMNSSFWFDTISLG